MYYLQTRYYDPEIGRFISQDSVEYLDPEHINGLNLYAYCGNNPVMAIDPDGTELEWWQWLLAGVVAVASIALAVVTMGGALAAATTITGAIVGGAYGGFTAAMTGQNIWEGIGIGMLAGISLSNISATTSFLAAKGLIGAGLAFVTNFVGSAAVGLGAEVLSQISSNGSVTNWGNVIISASQWGVLNSINFGLGYLADINIGNAIMGGYISNVMTGVLGFIVDLLKSNKLINRKAVK